MLHILMQRNAIKLRIVPAIKKLRTRAKKIHVRSISYFLTKLIICERLFLKHFAIMISLSIFLLGRTTYNIITYFLFLHAIFLVFKTF